MFIYRNPYNNIVFIYYIVLKYGEEIYAFLMRKQLTICVYITQQAIKKKRFCYASVHLGRSVELQQMKINLLYGLMYVDYNSSINKSGA